jgi:hypothetical protein
MVLEAELPEMVIEVKVRPRFVQVNGQPHQ